MMQEKRHQLTYHRAVMSTMVVVVSLSMSYARNIYVSKENGILDPSCWNSDSAHPCGTLALGLEGLKHYNQTTLWIESGTYILNSSTDGTSEWKYTWMSDIAVVGLIPDSQGRDLESPVHIECEDGAGLSFFYSNNITIRGVQLKGCGALHESTSRDFAIDKSHVFAKLKAAVYFLFCRDIVLEYIKVISSNGIGTVIYSTVGNNLIQNSTFMDNAAQKNLYDGGGGLYIEFSYCSPHAEHQDEDCKHSNVPLKYVSNAIFTINWCIFQNNTATISNPEEHTFILPQLSNHLAFGRGGGISVFFKGNATNNAIFVNNSQLLNNHALWGAGVLAEFQDMSNHNQFIMESSVLDSNECENYDSEKSGTGGGGVRIGYIFFDSTHCHNNDMTFINVNFTRNRAYYGGGLSFYVAKEPTEPEATNTLTFTECSWNSNIARVGSAADLSVWHPVLFGAIVRPSFTACSFLSNGAQYTSIQGSFEGIGALYADSIPIQFNEYVYFENNKQSAVASVGTGIFFESGCNAQFINNHGRNGGAIALLGYSFIVVSNATNMTFINNTAEIKGGAIYGKSIGEHDLISSRNCFIRYKNISASPYEWDTKFFFSNNGVAGSNHTNNSIYVTSLLTCLWGSAYGSTNSSTLDVFCWNNDEEIRWDYDDTDCISEIATSPATFYSNDTNSEFLMYIFPGKKERLPIETYDDRNKTVTDETVLFATTVTPQKIRIDSSSLYISDNQIQIHGQPNETGILKLLTTGSRVISTEVEVTIQPCPPGFILDGSGSSCKCGDSYGGLLRCDERNYSSQVQRGSWMGYWPKDNNETLYAGQCPYCALITESTYMDLQFHENRSMDEFLEETFCGQINRSGVLCGACKESYGPMVNSEYFKCVPCSPSETRKNWFFYLLTEFVSIIVFFLIVILLNVSITSGPANGFVFFAQVLTTVFKIDGDGSITYPNAPKWVHSFYVIPYDFWNLNFFRPFLPKFCLSSDISTLQLLSTGYVTAFCPLLLVIIFHAIVYLWSYYGKNFGAICVPTCKFTRNPICKTDGICKPICNLVQSIFARFKDIRNIKHSILHALATFIILSYTKFSLVSFFLLAATPLLNDKGVTHKNVLYYDGTIEFFSKQHVPYIVASILMILIFVLPPPIFLILPSIFHSCTKNRSSRVFEIFSKCLLNPKFQHVLSPFHGCYQDGTGDENGGDADKNKYDFRWFAGLYFILRLILFSMYAFSPDWFMQYVMQQLVCICAFVAFTVFRPYRKDFYNKVDATMFALLSAISTLTMYNYYLTVTVNKVSIWAFPLQYILILVPLAYISIYIFCTLCKKSDRIMEQWTKIKSLCQRKNDVDEENNDFLEHVDQEGDRRPKRKRKVSKEKIPLLHENDNSGANNFEESVVYGASNGTGIQTTPMNHNYSDSVETKDTY